MLIEIQRNIHLNVETGRNRNSGNIPLVFLHGFTGSSGEWTSFFDKLPEKFLPVAVDLIGHGKSTSPAGESFYTADAITLQLFELFQKLGLGKLILAGYSMGGRAALCFAVKYTQMVSGLILESTTAGIKDESERAERIKSDERLAELIEGESIENFIEYWMNIPLFASQKKLPSDILEKVRNIKLNNNRTGLAGLLRGFSTGRMPDLWNKLQNVNVRTLLLTGSLDLKFTGINNSMQAKLPDSKHINVDQAGHNIHLERPEVFLNLLNSFLTEF